MERVSCNVGRDSMRATWPKARGLVRRIAAAKCTFRAERARAQDTYGDRCDRCDLGADGVGRAVFHARVWPRMAEFLATNFRMADAGPVA